MIPATADLHVKRILDNLEQTDGYDALAAMNQLGISERWFDYEMEDE